MPDIVSPDANAARGLVMAHLQVARDEPGRKRDDGDRHQNEAVEQQERAVQAADGVDGRVMVEPDHQDRHEADDIGGIGRPLGEQSRSERGVRVRRRDREHEERRGDGEHAVAESLSP
jgi:hypothetical protein